MTPQNALNDQMLHAADEWEWDDVVALLQEGADPNCTDADGLSVLYAAVQQQQADVVRALLAASQRGTPFCEQCTCDD